MPTKLRVVILKPGKYAADGYVERFRWGFMPNSTLPHIRSMTPESLNGTAIEVHTVDEYVHRDLQYLDLLKKEAGIRTLLTIVGVQSHQFHRALDLAAYALRNGCMAVIGGPHPMTCDTTLFHNQGVSFALAEAELIWHSILEDATHGELQPVYGADQRWQKELDAPVIIPPSRKDLQRYIIPMLGIYPARGCPFVCSYCSVIRIAGRRVRSQSIETTIASLKAAKAAGVEMIMFTSDNFNKYAQAEELLNAMIDERINLRFFVQCDTQVVKQEKLVALLSRAGCFQMLLGVESFNRRTLLAAKKAQNRPESYKNIVELCRRYNISSHFSNIIGFPQDTEADIQHNLETICDLSPNCASFYILTPIPGTEQYNDFLSEGLISEKNLDRFDATNLTWEHPQLSSAELTALLFRCYRKFFSVKHGIANIQCALRTEHPLSESIVTTAFSAFNRYNTWRNHHPMTGGIRRIKLDSAREFLNLRRETYDIEQAPLPQNLQLPEIDQRLNRLVNLQAGEIATAASESRA